MSWVKGATELVETYQVDWPPIFVPNVLTFATEGKQYRYAGVATPVQHCHTWGAVNPAKERDQDPVAAPLDGLADGVGVRGQPGSVFVAG